jgi:hypothetical protein
MFYVICSFRYQNAKTHKHISFLFLNQVMIPSNNYVLCYMLYVLSDIRMHPVRDLGEKKISKNLLTPISTELFAYDISSANAPNSRTLIGRKCSLKFLRIKDVVKVVTTPFSCLQQQTIVEIIGFCSVRA